MKSDQNTTWKVLDFIFLSWGILSCSSTKRVQQPNTKSVSYDYKTTATDGWKLTRQDTLWGFITADEKKVIPPQFLWADQFKEGLALVKTKKGYTYISANLRVKSFIFS